MRVILQMGHAGRTQGATGAPGEQSFTKDVMPRVEDKLRAAGIEVRLVGADPTDAEIAGDWDLFLSGHYDSDSYNDDGGFVDYPEPSTDGATEKSQAIAKALTDIYFPTTGIKNMPNRSNKNTRYYYMWKRLSAKTPCVIIECGVGWRKPKDYETLHNKRDLVVQGIVNGVLKGLGGAIMPETMVVDKSDWDRLFKASELGDKLVSKLGGSGNIADKNEEKLQTILDLYGNERYNYGFIDGRAQGVEQVDPPTILTIKGEEWVLNGLTWIGGRLEGNYKRK